MAEEQNAFGLPNGEPIRSAWSRVIRNQKVALRKLLDNARFANAAITSDRVTGALRIWREDLQSYTDELTGRMTPYMTATITRSGKTVLGRLGYVKADDWFIRDPARVKVLEKTVLDLCVDTLDVMYGEVDTKVQQLRQQLIDGEIDAGTGGWNDLYTSLDKYFETSAKWRAIRIARTEASRAANLGIRTAAEELDDCLGFEWLMAPGACQACQTAGKNAEGKAKRVEKNQPFVRNLGPKETNVEDDYRRRTIPEEYRQVLVPPLHPNDRCSVKPIFRPLDGSKVLFDKPLDMMDQYIPNTAEIAPVNLVSPWDNPETDPAKNTTRFSIPIGKQAIAQLIKPARTKAIIEPSRQLICCTCGQMGRIERKNTAQITAGGNHR